MPVDVNALLKKAVQRGASDLIVKAGNQPIARINGVLTVLEDVNKLTAEDTRKMAFDVMTEKQREIFQRKQDIDISYSIPGNIYQEVA